MSFYIYKITNILNNKFYIGKTNDMDKRWYNHVYCALIDYEDTYFYRAIRKYGSQSFKVEIIEQCELEEFALNREIYWIDYLKSNNREIGYNMTSGGDGISGYKHTDETKNKIANIHLGKKLTEEHKHKIRVGNIGKTQTEEAKEKISKANSGENNGMYGKTPSIEAKQKMSDFQSTRARSPLSDEHKQKNREAALKQDRSYRIPIEIKEQVIPLYNSGKFTKKQIAEKLGLKYNSVVKIIRTA